jgi:hypothetical protein
VAVPVAVQDISAAGTVSTAANQDISAAVVVRRAGAQGHRAGARGGNAHRLCGCRLWGRWFHVQER